MTKRLSSIAYEEPRLLLPDLDGELIAGCIDELGEVTTRRSRAFPRDIDVLVEPRNMEGHRPLQYHFAETAWLTMYTHGTIELSAENGSMLFALIDDKPMVVRRFMNPTPRTSENAFRRDT